MKPQTLAFSLVLLCVVWGGSFLPGCATKIDPTGVYGTNNSVAAATFLLLSDKTLGDSKDTLNAFVTWELQNRAVLATVSPSVTKVADNIRDNAPLWFTNAFAARTAYIAAFRSNPSTAGPASNSFAASVSQISAQSLATSTITNSVKLH